MMLAAVAMFGGVYLWSVIVLAAGVVCLAVASKTLDSVPARGGWARVLDLALAAVLVAVLLQLLPLPVEVVHVLSPAREAFLSATSLQPEGPASFAPLTLDVAATLHAWLSLFCMIATFWIARGLFARGGLRTFSIMIACGAVALVVLVFAQHASGTSMVYGFWRPRDAGASPLGPFINRNHLGTWSLQALCLCAGYLQWRRAGAPAARSWRTRLSGWMDGRQMVLHLAIVLLAAGIALGASRSSLVALMCAAGYVALSAPPREPKPPQSGLGVAPPGRQRVSLAVLAALAAIAMLGYGDGARLLRRMDETRTTGMTNRVVIWRDAVPLIRDFPLTGVGAGAFGSAMRVYQTAPRAYHHNEAHNQYLQLVSEGGMLLTVPAGAGLCGFLAVAWTQLRRRDDPLRWMRSAAAAALVGVAVQSIWETGLTVPANGMLAAALAGLLVHEDRR